MVRCRGELCGGSRGVVTRVLLVASLLVASCHGEQGNGTTQNKPEGSGMKYVLRVQEHCRSGEPVNVLFTLENSSADTLSVLRWYTPLEGIMGAIFTVVRDSTELAYEGRMVKGAIPDRTTMCGSPLAKLCRRRLISQQRTTFAPPVNTM